MRTLFSKQLFIKCIIVSGFILFLNAGTTAQQDQSLEHWQSIVNKNPDDAKAWFNIGVLHETGQGAEKNQTRAHDAYHKSIDLGYAPAMYNLGSIYAKQKDYANARLWWEKAAELDLPEAQYNMGMLYEKGWGVSVDPQVSSSWYQRAAETAMEKYFQLYQKSRSEHLVSPDIGESSFGILDRVVFINTASAASAGTHITTTDVSASLQHPVNQITVSDPADFGQTVFDQTDLDQTSHQSLQLAQADTAAQDSKRPADWQWIYSQPAESFTIQLFATKDIEKTGKFIQQYALSERARVIQAVVKGTTYYKVMLGSFSEWNDAAVEIGAFPQDLRNQRPWVRKFGTLYDEFPEILLTEENNNSSAQPDNNLQEDSSEENTAKQDADDVQKQAKIEEITPTATTDSDQADDKSTADLNESAAENSNNKKSNDEKTNDEKSSDAIANNALDPDKTAKQESAQETTQETMTQTQAETESVAKADLSQAQALQNEAESAVEQAAKDAGEVLADNEIFNAYTRKQLASNGLSAELKAQLKSGLDAIKAGKADSGFDHLASLADSGLPEAQYRVALLYSNGEGVEQDLTKAFELMKSASEQGHPYAQQVLADYYVKGIGVNANSSLAAYWQQTAADNVKKLEKQ